MVLTWMVAAGLTHAFCLQTTVYEVVSVGETMILVVVSPVDHSGVPVQFETVSVLFSPGQRGLGLLLIWGVGTGPVRIVILAEGPLMQL
ncbi:hypothetical protein GCM10028803_33650 [Larkinella knui]